MRRNADGLRPHRESKIELSLIDKIIFGISAGIYGTTVILEEKFRKRTAVSSSFAIMAVGIFLFSRSVQKCRTGKTVTAKDKLKLILMFAAGGAMGIAGAVSLVFDIKKLIT